ncbi:hypothetical protein [Streptomyces palmae]|uniref:hypothetical protein n=1 Tax=Streptomyces palmae TaxID=1701085 RepID=UPI001FD74971|nr:hypothetical protein [Streptomyces palmae]
MRERLSRAAVNAALRDLDLAQSVKKKRVGVYLAEPMLAVYLSAEDAIAAVKAMPKNERLNGSGFVERYRKAVAGVRLGAGEGRLAWPRLGRRCCRWSGRWTRPSSRGAAVCSLCGAAAELDPVLKDFEQGFGEQ